jgi:preprotein translocase subunit SecA
MAGRGTDIKLGPGVTEPRTVGWAKARGLDLARVGMAADPARVIDAEKADDEVEIECGGLHIVGSERHESRRIDRQLRGRSGRQGDPGASQFFLSLEDDLMRLFGSDRIANIMTKLGAEEGEVITHSLVTRSIERAQRGVELQNFEARKRLLDYDDVMNQQREVIYDLRLFALEGGEDLKGEVWDMIERSVRAIVPEYAGGDIPSEEWDLAGLRNRLAIDYFLVVDELPAHNTPDHGFDDDEQLLDLVLGKVRDGFKRKLDAFGPQQEAILSWILLGVLDEKWREHLYDLDHLKASIGFRSWGQKDPLIEYKQEAYSMFVDLMTDIRRTVASYIFRAHVAAPQPRPAMPRRMMLTGPGNTPDTRPAVGPAEQRMGEEVLAAAGAGTATATRRVRPSAITGVAPAAEMDVRRLATNRGEDGAAAKPQPVHVEKAIGRNDPCPCGSGKKYKKCHGA